MAKLGGASPPVTASTARTRPEAPPSGPPGSVPLWRQLNATATVLLAVHAGQSWTTAQLDVDNALRPGVQALAYAVLRQYGTALAVRAQLAKRAPSAAVDALLCSVLALALAPPPDAADAAGDGQVAAGGTSYAAHTLVSQAVEAAKKNPATRAQAPFINACLRRFLRERDALLAQALAQPQAQWNHPAWWIKRLQQDFPKEWQSLLRANAFAAPLTLRVNTAKTTRSAYLAALAATPIAAVEVADSGLELSRSAYVPGLPGYAEGWFSVQDAAAQLAAPLLLDALAKRDALWPALADTSGHTRRPLRILDACAAPGGKTAHLLEVATARGWPVELLALDIDPARCQRIRDNLQRLQLTASVLAADAAQPATWWDGQPFDAILLDAPCTASGIVRRHPDIRWLRRATDIAQLAQLQLQLLEALWPLLKPGAPLLYCTCSVFKAEGHEQIQTFVARHTDAVLLPSPGHLLPQSQPQSETMPHNHLGGHDSFFYALLQKSNTP